MREDGGEWVPHDERFVCGVEVGGSSGGGEVVGKVTAQCQGDVTTAIGRARVLGRAK